MTARKAHVSPTTTPVPRYTNLILYEKEGKAELVLEYDWCVALSYTTSSALQVEVLAKRAVKSVIQTFSHHQRLWTTVAQKLG